jgi:hypothetical protein
VSQSPVTHAGWTGTGYAVADVQTGAVAYLIGGGNDGAVLAAIGLWMSVMSLAFIGSGAGLAFGAAYLSVGVGLLLIGLGLLTEDKGLCTAGLAVMTGGALAALIALPSALVALNSVDKVGRIGSKLMSVSISAEAAVALQRFVLPIGSVALGLRDWVCEIQE